MKNNIFFRRITVALLMCVLFLQMTGCSFLGRLVSKNQSSSAVQVSSAASIASRPKASKNEKLKVPRNIPGTKESDGVKRAPVEKGALSSSHYRAVQALGGYQALKTNSQKALYRSIGDKVYQVGVSKTKRNYVPVGRITVPGKLSEAQVRMTITAFLDDNPQVFWIANVYSYGYQGSRTVLQLYSELTQKECSAAVRTFNQKVRTILQSVPAGMSGFDREAYLFRYILLHCTYDDQAAQAGGAQWQPYTAYGALVNGTAVCEGYSRAMQLLGSRVGLPVLLLRGTAKGTAHMWNGVFLDQNWYHLDLTWCDGSNLVYNYFNVDDRTIKMTHVIAPVASSMTDAQICSGDSVYNLTLPACTSREENYFRKKGIVISTLKDSGDNAVVSAVANQMKRKQTTLAFYIAAGDYDTVIRKLTSASPYKLAFYLQKAAARAGISLNQKGISYVTDKADSGLNVFLTYP